MYVAYFFKNYTEDELPKRSWKYKKSGCRAAVKIEAITLIARIFLLLKYKNFLEVNEHDRLLMPDPCEELVDSQWRACEVGVAVLFNLLCPPQNRAMHKTLQVMEERAFFLSCSAVCRRTLFLSYSACSRNISLARIFTACLCLPQADRKESLNSSLFCRSRPGDLQSTKKGGFGAATFHRFIDPDHLPATGDIAWIAKVRSIQCWNPAGIETRICGASVDLRAWLRIQSRIWFLLSYAKQDMQV